MKDDISYKDMNKYVKGKRLLNGLIGVIEQFRQGREKKKVIRMYKSDT